MEYDVYFWRDVRVFVDMHLDRFPTTETVPETHAFVGSIKAVSPDHACQHFTCPPAAVPPGRAHCGILSARMGPGDVLHDEQGSAWLMLMQGWKNLGRME